MSNPGLAMDVQSSGAERLFDALSMMTLPPDLKRRYLQRMGRFVRHVARKNCDTQRTVDGGGMIPRQQKMTEKGTPKKRGYRLHWIPNKEKKGSYTAAWEKVPQKVLSRIARSKSLAIWVDPLSATVSWKNSMTGNIALRHQMGGSQTVSYKCYPKDISSALLQGVPGGYDQRGRPRKGTAGGNMCRHRQAIIMLKLGVTLPNGRPLNYDFIRENFTEKQAAFYIIKNRHKIQAVKTAIVKTPARPFLGLNALQRDLCGEAIMGSLCNRVMKNKAYKTVLETL